MVTRSGFLVAALLCAGVFLSCGCGVSGQRAWDASNTSRHPLSPTVIRIHPLTRLVRQDEGGFALDLHFELVDTWGHSTKALGELNVSLHRDERGRDGRTEPIRRWSIDLRDPDENARPYDRVTRTYRFLLTEIPRSSVRTDALRIRAQFSMSDGAILSAESRVERSPGGDD